MARKPVATKERDRYILEIYLNKATNAYHFTYVGSTITANHSMDSNLNIHLGKASTLFGRLSERVLSDRYLAARNKCRVYEAYILSILLYSTETWRTETNFQKYNVERTTKS